MMVQAQTKALCRRSKPLFFKITPLSPRYSPGGDDDYVSE
jgi:hypothetical protein